MVLRNSTGLLESSSGNNSAEFFDFAGKESFRQLEKEMLGTLLDGKFLIEKPIGRGSSSVVFVATDIKELTKVAVKVLVKDVDSAGSKIDRFNQETRTTRYLKHKNILEIYSYGIEKNHAYFVMEYLAGGTLYDLLNEKTRLEEAEAIEIIKQVASALAFAHKEGVIHRDIKPGNILFKDKERQLVKLVDFGMSTRLSWDYSDDVFRTPAGQIYGTTLYISPEQSKGESTDPKTDVYSLGCVFYECLAGMPPHMGKTAIDIVIKHQREEAIPINQVLMEDAVSIEVQTIIDKMLRKKLKDRYQNFDFILNDFEAMRRGEFDYSRYLAAEKQAPRTRIVRDYSNIVFILALLSVIATLWFACSILFFHEDSDTRLFDEGFWEQTSD